MAATWSARPNLSPAQVQERFGPGARVVRMGDGRWTIAGASPAATAPAAPEPAAPAAIPPQPDDPVSFERDSNIKLLIAEKAGLSGIYNPRREEIFIEGARGLTDEGFYDVAAPVAVTTDPVTGAISYQVAGQGKGRVARDNRNTIAASANSRGMLYSSAAREQQGRATTDLRNAREAALRRLAGQQRALTGQQMGRVAELSGQIEQAQDEYKDWRNTQMVPVAPPVAESFAPPAFAGSPAPRPPALPPTPGLPRIIRNPGASRELELRRLGYSRAGGATNNWVRR
jgi:hypothetical protein